MARVAQPLDQATIDRLKDTHIFYQVKGVWYCRLTKKGREVMSAKEQ